MGKTKENIIDRRFGNTFSYGLKSTYNGYLDHSKESSKSNWNF
jgi:hypothetical protein